MTSRRDLLTGALAAATLAIANAATPPARIRYRRIGHTGITWGYSADDAPNAIRDVGELGYAAFESFGSVLDAWETRGTLLTRLQEQKLPLIGAYCPVNLTDPSKRSEEILKAARWGSMISRYGGRVAVIGPDSVDRKSFNFAANRDTIVTTLNDICLAVGTSSVKAALHPHTGSCIQSRDEIWSVMESTNLRDVWLCPDTGELLAAGVDPLSVIKQFGTRIAHVHIKDYDAGAKHDGYAPVGSGKLVLGPIMDALEDLPQEFMVMAELNPDQAGNRSDPLTARRAAEQSKAAFAALGYKFRDRAS